MADDKNKPNNSDGAKKWPPDFDTYGDQPAEQAAEKPAPQEPEKPEAPVEKPVEKAPEKPAAPEKKSFVDTASTSKPEPSPTPKEEAAQSDKPSFMSLSGPGFGVEAKAEEPPAAEEPKHEGPKFGEASPEPEIPAAETEESHDDLPWLSEDEPAAEPAAVEDELPWHAEEESSPAAVAEEPEDSEISSFKKELFEHPEQSQEDSSMDDLFGASEQTSEAAVPEEPAFEASAPMTGMSEADEAQELPAAEPTDDFLDSLKEDPVKEDLPPDNNPYRAYAYYDFLQQEIGDDLGGGANIAGIKLNTQAIVLIVAVLIAGGWFAFQKYSEGQYKFVSKRERRKPVRKQRQSVFEGQEEKLPIWAITAQKAKKYGADRAIIKEALANSGRDNPFAVPEAVLTMVKQDIEAKIADEKEPEIYQKTAYRATLTGIVRSGKNVLAVVALRTAIFDIVEGTSKPKLLNKAIKEMNRAKDDSMELIQGDGVGPWNLVEIIDGRDTGLEAQAIIEQDGEQKVLRMGVPTDLGIYNELGELDVYREEEI